MHIGSGSTRQSESTRLIVQLCCAATDSHGEIYMSCAELNRAKDWEWDEKCKQFVPRASALVLLKAKSAEALGTRLKPNVYIYNVPISYPEYARSQVGDHTQT